MSLTELKSQIINKVNAIENELLLEDIYSLLNTESELDSIYKLSESERKGIEKGIDDSKQGRVYSSEKANELIREWLKK